MRLVTEQRGDPIQGSRFYRNFCSLCGDPIRVTEERRFKTRVACECCRPHPLHRIEIARHSRLIAD